MPTAAVNGVSFVLQSSPDNGVTWHTIAGAKKATLTRKTNAIDSTSKDDSGDKSVLAGLREWSVAFDQLWVSGDAGQLDLQAAQAAGTVIKIRLGYGNTTTDTYTGSGIVTDLAEDMPDNEAVTYTGTFQGSGPLTKAGLAH
ncbi:MAG TPA: phage tail tube protein [Chloroflexota bacterium]|nr:phage tail tube protein [Chloroflexota bacterium]